jgi:hypothetical protein
MRSSDYDVKVEFSQQNTIPMIQSIDPSPWYVPYNT